jgi:hypothetical protein
LTKIIVIPKWAEDFTEFTIESISLPVVPHKADRQVVGVVFFGMVAMIPVVTLPQLMDAVWCSAVVVAVVAVVVV